MIPPIKVCHLITDLEAGGAERNLVNVVTRADRTRIANEVISLLDPGITEIAEMRWWTAVPRAGASGSTTMS